MENGCGIFPCDGLRSGSFCACSGALTNPLKKCRDSRGFPKSSLWLGDGFRWVLESSWCAGLWGTGLFLCLVISESRSVGEMEERRCGGSQCCSFLPLVCPLFLGCGMRAALQPPKPLQGGCSSSCVPGDLLDVAGLLREEHNRLLSCDAALWAQFDWGVPNLWGMREWGSHEPNSAEGSELLAGSGRTCSDVVLLPAIQLGRDVPALPALPALGSAPGLGPLHCP